MLLDAINGGDSSDIHFEPYEKFYRIRYRTDGIFTTSPSRRGRSRKRSRPAIKVISRFDISEKRVPQDGQMKLVLSKTRAIDFRVSHAPDAVWREDLYAYSRSLSATLGIDALGYEPDQKEP